MYKFLVNILLFFILITSISYAKTRNEDAKLQTEYGYDLTHVPFFLRYDYESKYHKYWSKTYYLDRKYFLLDYETNLAVEKLKNKAEAKAEAEKEKRRLNEKKAALKKEKDRLKARIDEQKAEALEDKNRQKDFNGQLHAQNKEIQQMKQDFQRMKHGR